MSEPARNDHDAQIISLQAVRERRCAAAPPGHQMNTQVDVTTGLRVATCRKCGFAMQVNR